MGKKILLADDSITIQKVIELTFSDEDFDVVTVGNGRLALEKLNDVQPDVVLCDIIMPEKDGYEVCEYVKNSEAFSHVPVLLLTGAFEPFDQERAERVGSDGFLAKPFEPETLIAKVKDLLSRAPAPPSVGVSPGITDLGVTAPQAVVSPAESPEEPASRDSGPPPLAEVPPAVPPAASETAPPLGASLIPEQPFEAFSAGDEAYSDEPGAAPEPLAPVSQEELATLTGETRVVPPEPEEPDSASTVMFTAGQPSWSEQPAPPVEAPPEPGGAPEPPAPPDLAEETGAAFEEVLEEDADFGAATTGSDTQAPITAGVVSEEPVESSTFETVAPPPPLEPEPEPGPDLEPVGGEPEGPRTFEAPSAYSGEPPPDLEVEPARRPPEPPPVPEPARPPEPEAAPPPPETPVFEPEAPSAPEVPPVYEVPSAPEPAPPPEPEAPPAFEAVPPPEPAAPPVFEPFERPALESPPVEETAGPPGPVAPPVFEPFEGSAPESPPVEESPGPPEPVFEPIRPVAFASPSTADRPETTLPPVQPEEEPEAEPEAGSTPELRPEPSSDLEPGPPSVREVEAPAAAEPEPAAEAETAPTPVFELEPAPPELEPEPPSSFASEPERSPELESTPELEPEPLFAEPAPLPGEREGAPEPPPEPEAPAAPDEPIVAEVVEGPGREDVVESFADVETGGETEELPLSPSEAASVPVPVDMVEKIAQRVVAQVSDKVVREIAWEVIPDLAEALIKQEIERLKDELQKL